MLSVSNYALLIMGDRTLATDINELLLVADTNSLVLSYVLSLIPAFSDARLHYTTGAEISDGNLSAYLGSQDEWFREDATGLPNPSVSLSVAPGGWDAYSLQG